MLAEHLQASTACRCLSLPCPAPAQLWVKADASQRSNHRLPLPPPSPTTQVLVDGRTARQAQQAVVVEIYEEHLVRRASFKASACV